MKYFTATLLLIASASSASSSRNNVANDIIHRELVGPNAPSTKDGIQYLRERNLDMNSTDMETDMENSADTDIIDVDADTNSTDTTVTVGGGEDTPQGSSGVASTPFDLRAGAVAAAIVYFLI